jgi:hypothetical protein
MLLHSVINIIMQNYLRLSSKLKRTSSALKNFQRFPAGNVCLTFVFKETSPVASTASVNECPVLLLALDPEHLNG